jgi:hypothetical protein
MSRQGTGHDRSSRNNGPTTPEQVGFGSLQYILWTLWTIAVLTTAYVSVRPSLYAGIPVDLLGLIIHCILVGLIGLVVITMIELHLEPDRFPDTEPSEDD